MFIFIWIYLNERSEDRRSIEEFQKNEFIIHFGKKTDLLGLVQANFSYDARDLKCLFQYKNIESRLIDRYLRRKPLVDTDKIPLFEYSDVIYDANIFERLEAGNKQVTRNDYYLTLSAAKKAKQHLLQGASRRTCPDQSVWRLRADQWHFRRAKYPEDSH